LYPEPNQRLIHRFPSGKSNAHELSLEPPPATQRAAAPPPGKSVSTAQHYSQLIYAVPSERARAIFPKELRRQNFELAETNIAGHSHCWLSIVSYLDRKNLFPGVAIEEGFELTEYRVHVQREGQPYQWLLSTSVGSLVAVGTRHLWPLPWHLSAMEFRLGFDETHQRYQTYRLQMQSEHVNAMWELSDTGEPLCDLAATGLPDFVFHSVIQDCFVRRDGGVGTRQTRFRLFESKRGSLSLGRCDYLSRQGLLTTTELARPSFVQLSRSVAFEQEAPAVLAESEPASTLSFRRAA
jgi:hypothetical protein